MPPERLSSTTSSAADDQPATAACEICGSTESLSRYAVDPPSGDQSTIALCPSHYQVAATVSGARFQDGDGATSYDLQETRKITVRVPRALIESADAVAEQQGQTRSEFVRDGIQLAIEIQEMEDAFDEIVSRAVRPRDDTGTGSDTDTGTDAGTETHAETDVEFLKERIRTLESLLEDSIGKI